MRTRAPATLVSTSISTGAGSPVATRRQAALPNASKGRQSHTNGDDAQDRPEAKTDRGRKTRDALVAAAKVIFVRDGFLKARIVDICNSAGVSHGTFYTYFPSKEDIFAEVTQSLEIELMESPDDVPEDADAIDRIRIANRHYLEAYRANAGLLRVVEQVATFDEDVQRTRLAQHQRSAAAIEASIRRLQADGVADPTLDPHLSAWSLGGMVKFIAEHMFLYDLDADLEGGVETLTRLWVNALCMAPVGRRTTKPR